MLHDLVNAGLAANQFDEITYGLVVSRLNCFNDGVQGFSLGVELIQGAFAASATIFALVVDTLGALVYAGLTR
jgi:hypothetical protein